MSFGENMFKFLQITVGVLVAFLAFGTTTGNASETRKSEWIPTATFNQPRSSASDGQSKTREIPPSLRTLTPSQSASARTERALPLKDSWSEEDAEEIGQILDEGDALMAQRNWFEAKKLYENGLRRYPSSQALQEKFAQTRRRQEIEIRYQDHAFVSLTSASSINDVLTVFDEVFLDIEKYHVDRPSYTTLFSFGIAGVSEALSENAFYIQNGIPEESRRKALKTIDNLCKKTESIRFSTKDEVRRVILWVARQLKNFADIPETATISEFLCSAISSLDAYSSPLTPSQVEDVFSLIDGRFVGLGVELKTDAPTKIVRVIPGSPAEETGIVVGDEIISIDGSATAGLTGAEIGELLQGYEGEEAALVLRSTDSKIRKVIVVRRPINVPSVEHVHVLDSPGSIGYVKISCFQKTTANELLAAVDLLSKSQIKSLVVDLRPSHRDLRRE